MDYEKKYNEALAWMRELYPGLHGATKEDTEHYFPELRESEDEKARKSLLAYIKGESKRLDILKWIAYLEKQEQKPAESIVDRRQIAFMIEDARICGVIEGRKQVIDDPGKYGLQELED